MKSYRKAFGSVLSVMAVLFFTGCQPSSEPMGAAQNQPAETTASAAPAVKAQSLADGQSVNCTQTCSSPSAAPGESVTYRVNLSISGSAASGVQIQDILPSGMSYVQGTATTLSGGTFVCTGSTLTWVYNSVGPCDCVMTYVAQVNNLTGLVGSILQNASVMTCAGLSTAISSTVNLLVSSVPTLTPTVCLSTPTPTFTCAPATPTNTFTCVPPTNTFTPVPPTATFTFTCVPPTNTYTFTPTNTFTPVPPTATRTFTPVPPTATRTFTPVPPTPTNTFTAVPPTATRTFTPVPPTPLPTSTPIPIPTINISQVGSSLSAALGGAVTYTINLGVSGCSAGNVVVQDVLPSGMSYVQGSATAIAGGTFTCTGSTLKWVYNSVGPCSCTMTYVAQVNNLVGLVGSALTNTAVLTCPSLASSLSAAANLKITGLLGLGGGLGL